MKNSKILIILIFVIFACSKDKEKNTVSPVVQFDFMWLSTAGSVIVDSDGNQVILHGVNRSGLEYDKGGNLMNEAEIAYICNDWGADIIRIPFNQEWIMTDEVYVNMLDEVINWIKMNGAYVLLDLQWRDTIVKIPSIPDSEAINMWIKLATKYSEDPAILYDIHNETHDIAFSAWRERAIEIIEGIRSVHPSSLIFVSGMDWANDVSDWAANPLPYDNIVYSVHKYPWSSPENRWDGQFGNYSEQIPMFIGELGGEEGDINWGNQLLAYLARKKLGWAAWSWVDHPFLTRTDRQTPTDFGNLVRDYLVRYADPDQYKNIISNIKVEYIGAKRATITWKTTNASDSKVLYGLSSNYTETMYAPVLLNSHTIKLTDLDPVTTYHFTAISVDDLGFTAQSSDSTFTTAAE